LTTRIVDIEKQVGSKKYVGLEFKVAEKSAIRVYSLGPFPLTLGCEQRARRIDSVDGLRALLQKNES